MRRVKTTRSHKTRQRTSLMRKDNNLEEKKEKKSVPWQAWVALVAIILFSLTHALAYRAGANKPSDYVSPATCTKAFNAIATGLDNSRDGMAAAILGTEAPTDNAADVRELVKKCTGELPVIVPTTTKPAEGK